MTPGPSADEVLQALVVIIQSIQTSRRPNTATCPEDGCLIMAGRRCPACDLRNGVRLVRRRPATPQDDPKRPIRWVKQGTTRRPVYEQSEVA